MGLQPVMSILLMLLFLLLGSSRASWSVSFEQDNVTVHMNELLSMPFYLNDTSLVTKSSRVTTIGAHADESIALVAAQLVRTEGTLYYGVLNVTGIFLGVTNASVIIQEEEGSSRSLQAPTITVVREQQLIDTIFTASVAILVSILYINFGCAIDWTVCRSTLLRPVGPAIGFFCQFAFMPLLSYAIGQLLFPDNTNLQLGLFFTGISPSGGASNIWTVLLGGNLNLSVTMTTLYTLAAFGTMPFWIFTLGKRIFARANVVVPYRRIATFAIGLIIPLAIGLCVQKKLPKLSRILIRLMKPLSILLIVFIITFAILTNLYLLRLFSKEIAIAGMILPWSGFLLALSVAYLFRQPYPDMKAIAIETSIQNTGVAIFLLKFTLEPPMDDLSTVLPVSVAIMTPIPLMVFYVARLIGNRRKPNVRPQHQPSMEKFRFSVHVSDVEVQ